MNIHKLTFVVFLLNKYALATNQTANEAYIQLNRLKIIDEYILKHFDVLHAFGEKYLIEDLKELVTQKSLPT